MLPLATAACIECKHFEQKRPSIHKIQQQTLHHASQSGEPERYRDDVSLHSTVLFKGMALHEWMNYSWGGLSELSLPAISNNAASAICNDYDTERFGLFCTDLDKQLFCPIFTSTDDDISDFISGISHLVSGVTSMKQLECLRRTNLVDFEKELTICHSANVSTDKVPNFSMSFKYIVSTQCCKLPASRAMPSYIDAIVQLNSVFTRPSSGSTVVETFFRGLSLQYLSDFSLIRIATGITSELCTSTRSPTKRLVAPVTSKVLQPAPTLSELSRGMSWMPTIRVHASYSNEEQSGDVPGILLENRGECSDSGGRLLQIYCWHISDIGGREIKALRSRPHLKTCVSMEGEGLLDELLNSIFRLRYLPLPPSHKQKKKVRYQDWHSSLFPEGSATVRPLAPVCAWKRMLGNRGSRLIDHEVYSSAVVSGSYLELSDCETTKMLFPVVVIGIGDDESLRSTADDIDNEDDCHDVARSSVDEEKEKECAELVTQSDPGDEVAVVNMQPRSPRSENNICHENGNAQSQRKETTTISGIKRPHTINKSWGNEFEHGDEYRKKRSRTGIAYGAMTEGMESMIRTYMLVHGGQPEEENCVVQGNEAAFQREILPPYPLPFSSTTTDIQKSLSIPSKGAPHGSSLLGLEILVSEDLLVESPVFAALLSQKHGIRCVDAPLQPPVSFIVDEVTAVCLLPVWVLHCRSDFKVYLRNLTKQAFKFDTLWLVVLMTDEDEVNSEALVSLFQSVSQFPCAVIVRQACNLSVASIISAACVEAAKHSAVQYGELISTYKERPMLSHVANNQVFTAHCEFLQLFPSINFYLATTLLQNWRLRDIGKLALADIEGAIPIRCRYSLERFRTLLHRKFGVGIHSHVS